VPCASLWMILAPQTPGNLLDLMVFGWCSSFVVQFVWSAIPVVLGSERPRVLGKASPSDAYQLPQILPQELQPFGRSGDDFGEVSLRIRVFLRNSSTDRPRMVGGQSAAGGHSARGCGPFCGPFRQNRCFSAGSVFCTADSPRLSSGQSATARRTVRSVRRNLPSLIGSYASLLVLSCVLRGIIPRTCSWSITMLSWRLVFVCDFWSCDWDIGRVPWRRIIIASHSLPHVASPVLHTPLYSMVFPILKFKIKIKWSLDLSWKRQIGVGGLPLVKTMIFNYLNPAHILINH
jgi:hypothetical protein